MKLHCSPAASPSPAALSFSSHWAESRRVDFVVRITNTAIARHLSPKLRCSMLAEDAIKAAVSDYKQKQAKANNKRAADVIATPAACRPLRKFVHGSILTPSAAAASFAADVILCTELN